MAGLILLLVFVAGYAVQRGSTCAVAAVHALVEQGRGERFLSFLLCAAVALAVMAAGALLGWDSFDHYRGSSAALMPIAGGALFGLGAWLNGRCAFGTIARLGAGEAARLGTLAGFFAGFALADRTSLPAPTPDLASPLLGANSAWVLAAALSGAALLALATRRHASREEWSPLRSMGLIGVINGALLLIAAGWPYTNLLIDLATSTGMDIVWRGLMALVFIIGSLSGALLSDTFRAEAGARPAYGRGRSWAGC